jgi:hypothetical protein
MIFFGYEGYSDKTHLKIKKSDVYARGKAIGADASAHNRVRSDDSSEFQTCSRL